MSIKSLLMPIVSSRLLSRDRLLKARVKAERLRHSQGEPHRLHYFHQVDDPYSAILASRLGALLKRYDIVLSAHVVGPPQDWRRQTANVWWPTAAKTHNAWRIAMA